MRIGRFEDPVLHPAGHRDQLGEVLLDLHQGILDLVVSLHFDDDVFEASIHLYTLENEVGVIAAHGARLPPNRQSQRSTS